MSAVIFDRHRGRCLLLLKLTLLKLTLLVLTLLMWMGNFAAAAAELKEGQSLLLAGDYSGCIKMAREALRERPGSEDWNLVLSEALLETGQYPAAQTAM